MRILGLDLGAKRIGLAISDSEGSIAFPMETLQHRDLKKDLEAICAVIIERDWNFPHESELAAELVTLQKLWEQRRIVGNPNSP